MASRAQSRAQFTEYSQLFVSSATVVFCTVWVTFATAGTMNKLYEGSGMKYQPSTVYWFPGLGLLLIPIYAITVLLLKKHQVSGWIVILAAHLFAVAAMMWVLIAYVTITAPMTPIGY